MAIPIAQSGAIQQSGSPQQAALRPIDRPRSETTGTPAPAQPEVDTDAVTSAVESQAAEVISGGRTIEFSFNDEIKRVVVKVKSDDDEIVRQIPPDDYLKFLARFKELAGVLFDETA